MHTTTSFVFRLNTASPLRLEGRSTTYAHHTTASGRPRRA